ncbi:uncharacterized protein LOC5516928 [Nematostella vectensis]|uniref:uncharacterized protein LOC5516928 n=1 Tax=Nematostella vectensis TaxID=45351 RepID=UPI00207782F6|nr:uncharacterized protein LOC5516928 [Nematostella vectensis]
MGGRRTNFKIINIPRSGVKPADKLVGIQKSTAQPLHAPSAAPFPENKASFTQKLFEHPKSQAIVDECKRTKFMRGMAEGTLLADLYGGYMVQDPAYCYHAVPAYELAADKLQSEFPEFSLLYRRQSGSFQKYNQDFVNTWRIKGADSIVLGEAAKTYVKYESAISQSQSRKLCIAMLPCQMLWPKLANDMGGEVREGNPYKPWFDGNKSDHPSHLERFIDYFLRDEKVRDYLDEFLEGMTNELNFFRDACGEELYYYTKEFQM